MRSSRHVRGDLAELGEIEQRGRRAVEGDVGDDGAAVALGDELPAGDLVAEEHALEIDRQGAVERGLVDLESPQGSAPRARTRQRQRRTDAVVVGREDDDEPRDDDAPVPAARDRARVHVARVRPEEELRIDGRLDEEEWQLAPAQGRFIQREPTFAHTRSTVM